MTVKEFMQIAERAHAGTVVLIVDGGGNVCTIDTVTLKFPIGEGSSDLSVNINLQEVMDNDPD